MAPMYFSHYLAVRAMQRGEVSAAIAAVDDFAFAARQMNDEAMRWHSERALLLIRMQTGPWREALPKLRALHRRARLHDVAGTAPFVAFDLMVLLSELGGERSVIDDVTRRALRVDECEPPSLWALKTRALQAAGSYEEAHAALHRRSATALADLPKDTQYVGTLGMLARVSLALGGMAHVDALYALLACHRGAFATHEAFLCEGSVTHLLGIMATALGRYGDAAALLEDGIAQADRAGLLLAAADARLALALVLHRQPSGRREALSLAREVRVLLERTGTSGHLARTAGAIVRASPNIFEPRTSVEQP